MDFNWQPMVGSSFVSFLLSFMVAKAWRPFAPKRSEDVLLEVPMGWFERLLVHRTQGALLIIYLLLGSIPDAGETWFLEGTPSIGLVGLAVVLSLPMRYVFTTTGVGINNNASWGWKTFRKYDVRPARSPFGVTALPATATIRLSGRAAGRGRAPDRTLHLRAESVNEATRIIRRCVR